MQDSGNSILLEDGTGHIATEGDVGGVLLLESAPETVRLNNYQHFRSGDGMSVTEKIR